MREYKACNTELIKVKKIDNFIDFSLAPNYTLPMNAEANKHYIAHLISKVDQKIKKFLMSELAANNLRGLHPSHAAIVFTLLKQRECTMKELADAIDKDKSTTTGLVAKLIKLGYLEKSNDRNDRRVTIISLTEKGKLIEETWFGISKKLRKKIFNALSDKEIESVIQILLKLEKEF